MALAFLIVLGLHWSVPVAAADPGDDETQADVAPVVEAPIWPATGPITSRYGPGHPLGIDIGIPQGTPILASTGGFVTFAGGTPCCGYGLYVSIVNGQGLQMVYAHLSTIFVWQGQWVTQGQVLGLAGRTGHATGPHLHFEVLQDGVIVNPMTRLP